MEDVAKNETVTIDGVEYLVTLAPVLMAKTPVLKTKKDIFDVETGDGYYYIAKSLGTFKCFAGIKDYDWEAGIVERGQGASDEEYIERLVDTLNLHCLLKKYAEQNNKTYHAFNKDKGNKYIIAYDCVNNTFTTDYISFASTSPLEVYFSDRETARKALVSVVEPFMKEHPEYEKYIKEEK